MRGFSSREGMAPSDATATATIKTNGMYLTETVVFFITDKILHLQGNCELFYWKSPWVPAPVPAPRSGLDRWGAEGSFQNVSSVKIFD